MKKSVNRREFISALGVSVAGIQTLAISCNSGSNTVPPSNTDKQLKAVNSKNLVIYSVPEGEELSSDYTVEINRNPVGIQTARVNDPPNNKLDYGGKYSFINFDFSGSVHVRIYSKRTLEMLQIRPLSSRIQKSAIDENTVEFTLDRPCFLSFEPEGKRHPLLIFANPLEVNPPNKSNPDVIYFGPGIHKPEGGVINLKSKQTLYLAGGAVVHAAINVEDSENVSIRGRGILDGSSWKWINGPLDHMVHIVNSKNITIEGVILRGSFSWTLVPLGCENVTVENLKICGGRVRNDDGIDPCNTRHMVIKNTFVRADDDCIAVKGMKKEWGDVDDILVENTVLWNDRSMIVRLGVESRTVNMKNLVFRNMDIIHYGRQAFVFEPEEEMNLENVLLEDIRIEADGQRLLIAILPVIHPYTKNRVPGHVNNIHFKKIKLTGGWGDYGYASDMHPYEIEIGYVDNKHRCEGVVFEDFTILGEKLTQDARRLITNIGSPVIVK
jgi:hypothetical protein